jgi:hypothetical protein
MAQRKKKVEVEVKVEKDGQKDWETTRLQDYKTTRLQDYKTIISLTGNNDCIKSGK